MKIRIAVLAALALSVAPAAAHAQGVTNPAKHPSPIEVTIDGQTYSDGRDTLPGYDDVACTPIPGIVYDFENNQIQYNDGDGKLIKTANWTEWERISSYDDWVKSKTKPTATATPTATSQATSTPTQTQQTTQQTQTQQTAATQNQAAQQNTTTNTTSTTNKSSSTKNQSSSSKDNSSSNKSQSTSKSSSSTKSSTSSAGSTSTPSSASTPGSSSSTASAASGHETTTSSSDPSVPATDEGAPAPAVDGTASDLAAGAAPVDPNAVTPAATETVSAPNGVQVVAAAGPGAASNLELASQTADLALGDSPTRLAGVAILIALVALGFFTLAFGEIRNHLFGRR